MPDVIKVTDDQVTDAPDIKFITLPDSMIAWSGLYLIAGDVSDTIGTTWLITITVQVVWDVDPPVLRIETLTTKLPIDVNARKSRDEFYLINPGQEPPKLDVDTTLQLQP
jgi:hypothetical protein